MPELDNLSSLFNDANLVAYYKLENTADSKGSAILTNNGTATFDSARFGKGANFGTANTTKYLSTTALTSAGKENALTIAMWAKITTDFSANGEVCLAYLGEIVANYIVFEIRYRRTSGVHEVFANRRKESVANQATTTIVGALGTEVYHHFVMTYDGTTLKMYVDSGTPGTVAASGNGAGAGSEQAEFRIGRGRNLDNGYVNAIVDDVAVWSRALTATEVETLYRETNKLTNYRPRKRTPGLVSI